MLKLRSAVLAAFALLALLAFPSAARATDDDVLFTLLAEAEELHDARRWAEGARKLEAALALSRASGGPSPEMEPRIDDILADLVRAYFALSQFKPAMDRQRELLDRFLERDEPVDSADAAIATAILAIKLKLFKEAERQLLFAEVLYTEQGLKPALAKVAYYKALAAQGRRDYPRTVSEYNRARDLQLAVGNGKEAALRLLNIGNVLKEYLNNFDAALEHFDRAIAELEALGESDLALNARIDKGNTLVELGHVQASLELLTRTLAAINPKKAPVAWVRASQMLAKAHYRAGEFHEAGALLDRLLGSLLKVDDIVMRASLEIDALNLRAMIAAELGRYETAFQDFDAALRRAREHDLQAKEAYLHNNMGYWLREMGKTREAVTAHEKALAIDRDLGSPDGIAYDLRNLGLAKTEAGDVDHALALLTEALDMSTRIGGAYNIAYSHLGLGEVQMRKGNWAAALVQFNASIALAEKHKLTGFAWQAHAGLAAAAFQQGDKELAAKHFKRAVEVIEQIESGLRSDEARKDFKNGAKVQKVFRSFESLLRQMGKDKDADAVGRRGKPQVTGTLPSI